MKENCLLWEKAKILGQERGITLSGVCPIDAYCKGEQCIFLSIKREKTDEEKLEDLRQELKKMKN